MHEKASGSIVGIHRHCGAEGVEFTFTRKNSWHGKFFVNGNNKVECGQYNVKLDDGRKGQIVILNPRKENGGYAGQFTTWIWEDPS